MLNCQKLMIELFVDELRQAYRRTYSDMEQEYGNIIGWCGRLALENIANSDALYHNVEHTMTVVLAGQSIIEGKHLSEGGVPPRDWMHYMIALLCHDIGYVKGVCRNDRGDVAATGIGEETIVLAPGGTDIALTPHHVDRSKLFVHERFSTEPLKATAKLLDAELVASYIEMTRFPPPDKPEYKDTKGFGGLVRAADFIGQLGDPNHMRKAPALFYEFEEIGANAKFGYKKPGDLRLSHASFYWNMVSPYVQDALRYLQVTQDGKEWVASLQSHVFVSEHNRTG
jgi:hypothetical protein